MRAFDWWVDHICAAFNFRCEKVANVFCKMSQKVYPERPFEFRLSMCKTCIKKNESDGKWFDDQNLEGCVYEKKNRGTYLIVLFMINKALKSSSESKKKLLFFLRILVATFWRKHSKTITFSMAFVTFWVSSHF